MTHVATMGAFSCACISIAGWKDNHANLEEDYLDCPEEYEDFTPKNGLTLQGFYDEILYPTVQELGRTGEYPFSLLMKKIDSHSSLSGKYIVAVLAEFQVDYWSDKLKAHGFELVDKTDNDMGTINYIYVRNYNRVEIDDDE